MKLISIVAMTLLLTMGLFFFYGCSYMGQTQDADLKIECRDCDVSYIKSHAEIDNKINTKGL